VVLADNPPVVRSVVGDACTAVDAPLTLASDGTSWDVSMREGRAHLSVTTPRHTYTDVTLGLAGRHQVDNAITALRLLELLADIEVPSLEPAAMRAGLEQVEWPGRLELVAWRGHSLLIDGAHNPAGARALAAHVTEAYGRRLPMVVSVLGDKDAGAMLGALAAAASHFVFTTPGVRRAASPAHLAATASSVSPTVPVECMDGPEAALECASALGTPVVVAGSLYLVGAVRSLALRGS
jgi:dihydrofolate synthase/folylpolyglutamate synthase